MPSLAPVRILYRPERRAGGELALDHEVRATDYGMRDEQTLIKRQAALLFLFIRGMRLDQEGGLIELVNRAEVQAELRRRDARFRSQLAAG